MLEGVIQFGQYMNEIDDEDIGIIENPNDKGMYKHIFKLAFFRDNEGKFDFKDVEYEEFSMKKIIKYAYKKGGSRGGDYTPTSKLTESAKTIEKIISSVKNILKLIGKDDVVAVQKELEGREFFKFFLEYMKGEKENIMHILDEHIKSANIPKKEAAIITITLWDNETEKYVGNFEIVKKFLHRMSDERFYTKYQGKVSKGEGTCFYCKNKGEVYGFVNTYNFYTLDKKGFITRGFRQEDAWRNYPVCSECANNLEKGRKYIEHNFTSKFAGFNYCIIPKVIFNDKDDKEYFYEILEQFEKNSKFSTKEKEKDNLLCSEDNFIEAIAETSNNLNYNMLIFKEEQSGNVFRILLFIEDVVPSRVKKILRVKEEIDGDNLFGGYQYSFKSIRYFFPNNKFEGDFDKSFLEILNKIFTNKKISFKFLLSMMVKKLREKAQNDENIEIPVLTALMNIMFLSKLDLFLDKEKGEEKIVVEKNEKNKKYLDFLEEHNAILDSDYKKAVFLEGVLIDRLLKIQYTDKGGSTPFYSRLNGLKLNKKLVERIFTEAINKLNEYNKNYYTALEEIIGEYMLSKCTLSDDEISYYFSLGIVLGKKFKNVEGEN